jgi:hypothetical protein
MKMMSAAILITTATGQTDVHPVSPDRIEPDGISFAKSLNERVGYPASLPGISSTEEMAAALRSSKCAEVASKSDEIAAVPSEVKKATVAGQVIPVGNELKSALTKKNIGPQTIAVAGAKGKMTASSAERRQTEPPVQGEEVADDISTSSTASEPTSATRSMLDPLVPSVSITDGGEPLVSSGDGVAVPQGRAPVEKAVEHASVKKFSKSQENVATSKIAPKLLGTTGSAPAIEVKPATTPADGSVSLGGQGVGAVVVVPPNEISKTTGAANQTFSGAKSVIGVNHATVSEPVRKENTPVDKSAAMDTEAPLPTGDGTAPLAKPGTGAEKFGEVVIAANNNGDGKTQNISASTAGMVHAISGTGLSAGIVPSVAPPSGDLSGIGTATKLPIADATLHTAGLQLDQRELRSPGVITTTNEMPRVLTAIPTALEVGIQSGTHGWLKVRAEMVDGGVVNASVSAVSSAGQEMLHRELPALTSYLQEEKVVVNALVVHSTAETESRGSATGMDGGGGPTQQRSNEGGEQRQYDGKTVSDGTDEVMSYQSLNRVGEDGPAAHATFGRGGSWLSVRA